MTEAAGPVILFPAIDLRRGRCVRLEQGVAERETMYATDPFHVAARFAAAGASWVHLVDLDAAFGEGSNRDLIGDLAERTGLRVQTGGGLRDEASLEQVLEGPISRAVIGTAAIENPHLVEWAVERWGAERIAVGLDARGLTPAIRGWRESTGSDLFEVAESLAARGARTFIYTDIDRDGMLAGPNLDTAGSLADHTGCEVIVSGGVGSMADLEKVAGAARSRRGIAGLIVGKAIYEGRIDVKEALRVLAA